MDSVESSPDLFSKIGPLPAWAWGALAVGGYVVFTHMHATKAAADTVDPQTVDATNDGSGTALPSVGYGAPLDPSSAGYDYNTTLDGSYSGSVAGTVFTSNQQWAVYAIENLLRAGYPPSVVTSGITHYLAGSPLTQAEEGVVSAALQLVGPPPLPLPIVSTGSQGVSVPVQPSGGTGSTSDGTQGGGSTVATDPGPVAAPSSAPATAPAPAPAVTESPITVKNVLTAVKLPGVNKVKLAWTPVPHADGYHVWKDGREVGTTTSLTWTTQLLAPGKHTWWVQAYNKVSHLGGNSASVTIR